MLDRTKARALPVLNSGAEHMPMVTACCNACRACVTTNILTLLTGAAMAGAAAAARVARRFARSS